MVAAGYPPHDHRDRFTWSADLTARCRAGVVCRLSPEEQQRNLETLMACLKLTLPTMMAKQDIAGTVMPKKAVMTDP